jgi:hypothetical protein
MDQSLLEKIAIGWIVTVAIGLLYAAVQFDWL